ncbi:MAG: L-lactate dehydrogenase [Patescibacteria group bacterium]
MDDKTKVAVVGCGKVGITAAYTMYLKNSIGEIILYDRNKEKVAAERLDFLHSLSFLGNTQVNIAEDIKDLEDSDVIVYATGAAQAPGETRLELVKKNTDILEAMLPEILKHAPESTILMVSNPVDILTFKANEIAGVKRGRIFGSGTTLDTARFRYYLSETLKVNPINIHGYILGEHGDSSFPTISTANIGGEPISSMEGASYEILMDAYKKARNAAYEIIAGKGATYYSIAVVVDQLVNAILSDSKRIFPVSVPLEGEYGIKGVSLSVPCIISRQGVEKIIELNLSPEEMKMMSNSAETLKKFI